MLCGGDWLMSYAPTVSSGYRALAEVAKRHGLNGFKVVQSRSHDALVESYVLMADGKTPVHISIEGYEDSASAIISGIERLAGGDGL